MIVQTATIAKNTFVESIRQPIFFIVLMLSGALQVFTTWSTAYSMGYTTSAEISKDNKLLVDIGLGTIFVAGMLLAAFIATAVLNREIESKTVLTVVSKPISRTSLILGKYIGVAGAITIAVLVMTIYLLLGLRHGVMSTAADDPDYPVILFSSIAVFLTLGVAGWCNFYYGWSFPQTASLLLLPLIVLAYIVTLFFNKSWEPQPLFTDFKPQVMIACAAVLLALLVLSAVAIAASSRLGQVMTIVICAGVFMLGLLSNYMLGRRAYHNTSVGIVERATPKLDSRIAFNQDEDVYTLLLKSPPKAQIKINTPVYYGSNPNGFQIIGPKATHSGKQADGIFVKAFDNLRLLTIELKSDRWKPSRPPQPGDFVFLTPTQVSPIAATLYAIVPNFQHFWLIDAVTRNSKIPASHLELLAGYAGAQITGFLALAIILFQRRDVG